MSTQKPTEPKPPEYLLLIRGTEWHKGMSPEEIQKVMGQFLGWLDRLTAEGKFLAGQPLTMEGKVVSGKPGGRMVADGPYAESKEAVGGYFLLRVDTLEEATAIAKGCPALDYGATMEVRRVAEVCPVFESVGLKTMRRDKELAGAAA